MTYEIAAEISKWTYEYPYSVYNLNGSEESAVEMLREGYVYALDTEKNLFGFYCTGMSARVPTKNGKIYSDDGYLDIGLGIKPHLTGKGSGSVFVNEIMEDIFKKNGIKKFRLSVALFNTRAIKCYEKSGFIKKDTFLNPKKMEFLTMVMNSDRFRTSL